MVSVRYVPDTGHIIKVDLDPSAGHEQGGWRPAVVLSPISYNGKTNLAVVVPITNQVKGYPFEVRLPTGMRTTGVILTDQVRNLDWHARRAKYIEAAPAEVLTAIQERLGALFGIAKS
jgi:mRNA interferase MazF